jgi:hypothetical protein
MKKLLLLLLVAFTSTAINAQGTSYANATNVIAGATVVVTTMTGTLPTVAVCYNTYTMNQAATPVAAKCKWFKYTPTVSGIITVTSALDVNPVATADTRLRITTGTSASTLTCAASNDDIDAATNDYRAEVKDLTVTAGTTYYIIWDNYWSSAGFSFQLTFTAQSCFKPTAFTYLAAPTTTEVNFGWTAPVSGGAPSGYEIEYGETSFIQGSGTTVNVTDPSVILSGLTPSSVYDFYIRSRCSATDTSIWVGPITFNTVFEDTTVPYSESFEASSLPYVGWSKASATGYTGPTWDTYAGTAGSTLIQDGLNAAFVVSSATLATDTWMLSRGIILSAGTPVTISYYVRNYVATPSTNTSSYDLKAGTGKTIADMTIPIASETGLANVAYEIKEYTFTPTTDGTYYLGFNAKNPSNAAGTHAFFLDNLFVDQVLSVKGVDASKFTVYPNPANNILNVSNSVNDMINSVKITDLTGKTVKESNFVAKSSIQMNIADIVAGVYMMTIKTDKGSITKKIVKN